MISDLVEVAEALAVVAGGRERAVDLAVRILVDGQAAFPRPRDDRERHLVDRARRSGAVNADGTPNVAIAAELVRICDLMCRLTPPPQRPAPEPDLVFTVPPGVPIEPAVRLDLLVADVIRMATASLHIGGPFWNRDGFALLDPVVRPAAERGVEIDLWFDAADGERSAVPREWAASLARAGAVREHWYQSDGASLMHAKFVVADRERGYLGTANLTSLGLGAHVEVGVELGRRQCQQLVEFLSLLDDHDRFQPSPQRP